MTTTTLRPNATASGTVAHASLSDNSDASFLDGSTVSETTTVAMAGGVTVSLAVRFRGRAVAGTQSMYAEATKASGSTLGFTQRFGVGTTITDYTSGQIAAPSLTQAEVDGLRIKLQETSTTGSVNTRFTESYLDLVWVAVPVTVVTVVTPDPYTASNLIPIAWTNTLDTDGGAQSRYRLKVFTAAQYGIGGFDPETSPNSYDSGDVLSGSLTASTGVLANSTTFRAYVKVAQTVNGVSHWSAWAFDQFAVSVTTSDVLTVTAAGSNSGAYIDVTVNRNTGTSAWNFVEVQRSTDAGVTWSNVRGVTYVDSTGNANTFTVKDYETGNAQATLYRARATRIVSSLPISGAWVQSTPSASWSSNSCWLKVPGSAALNTVCTFINRGPYQRARSAGVFHVIGQAAPVVLSDVLSKRSGTMIIETYDSAEAAAILTVLNGAPVVLVQLPALFNIADFYGSIISTDEMFVSTIADVTWRQWSVSYIEVNAPADPLASAP